MEYRFLIHDLDAGLANEIFGQLPEDVIVFPAKPRVKHCVGCFGCWVKTPGKCVIADRCSETPAMLAASKELILVTRNVYGGYSPEVKAVLDRSIGYMMPYFRLVEDEMHHTMRYDNLFTLTAHFYGCPLSEEAQSIAQQLVKANQVNLGAQRHRVYFHSAMETLKGAIQ